MTPCVGVNPKEERMAGQQGMANGGNYAAATRVKTASTVNEERNNLI